MSEINWYNIHIDHCLPVSTFIIKDEIDMWKCFNWVNLGPMCSNENVSKGAKIIHHLYLLKKIKKYVKIK